MEKMRARMIVRLNKDCVDVFFSSGTLGSISCDNGDVRGAALSARTSSTSLSRVDLSAFNTQKGRLDKLCSLSLSSLKVIC